MTDFRTLDVLGPSADPALVGLKAQSLGVSFSLGLRVPDGFVIPAGVVPSQDELERSLGALGELVGARLGDPAKPLVCSVRSSSPRSLPGQLDTILSFGATLGSVPALAGRLGSRKAALEVVVQGRRDVAALAPGPRTRVRAATEAEFETALERFAEVPPTAATLRDLIARIRERASAKLTEPIAIVVQAMVFGNASGLSGALVGHSRHPLTGEPGPRGEWAPGLLGDQLTGGHTAPSPISARESPRTQSASLEVRAPSAFAEVGEILRALERAFRAPVEVELTLENGALHVLQARPSALGPVGQVAASVALVEQQVLSRREAILRVDAETLRRAGESALPDADVLRAQGVVEVGRGLVASPGVASGRLYISVTDAVRHAAAGPVVLVRSDASPEDAPAVRAAAGVATASGGLTSHAAVMSRALGRPCTVSLSTLRIDEKAGTVSAGTTSVRVGEWVTVDGTEGRLLRGQIAAKWTTRSPAAQTLLGWANQEAGLAEDQPGPWYEALRSRLGV